jgi:hypothetical protein
MSESYQENRKKSSRRCYWNSENDNMCRSCWLGRSVTNLSTVRHELGIERTQNMIKSWKNFRIDCDCDCAWLGFGFERRTMQQEYWRAANNTWRGRIDVVIWN